MIISLCNINFGGGSGGGGGTVRVIDNLESTSSTAALSAKQGKVLGDHISEAELVIAMGCSDLQYNKANSNQDWEMNDWGEDDPDDGIYSTIVDGNDEGKRLHACGYTMENENPRIDWITTSEQARHIVCLTQSDYDDLELAGELDANTLYAIVEPLV